MQALQTALKSFWEMFGTGIVRPLTRTGSFPSALGRDDQIGRIRVEWLGDQLFGCVGTIGIRSVDQIHTKLNRSTQRCECGSFIGRRSPDSLTGDAHRAVPYPVDCEITTDREHSRGGG